MIMEKMGGGGHMSAAAMQKTRGKVADLKNDLLEATIEYFKEDSEDESNS